MSMHFTKLRSPADRYMEQLESWANRPDPGPGVTDTHMDLAEKGIALGNLYRSVKDERGKANKDASKIASQLVQLTLNTLQDGDHNEVKVKELNKWFQWLEELLGDEDLSDPIAPRVTVFSLVERLHEIATRPREGFNLDPGPDFKGIDMTVADETRGANYTTSEGGRVNFSRGGEVFGTNVAARGVRAAVYDGTANNTYTGDFERNMGAKVDGGDAEANSQSSRLKHSSTPAESSKSRQYYR